MSFTLTGTLLLIIFNGGKSITCPNEYHIIETGCYKINNDFMMQWSDARQYCTNDSKILINNATVPHATTHLVALEHEMEKNALFYWMKAYNIQGQFWTDGIVSTSLWSWSNQSMEWFLFSGERAATDNGSNYKLIYNGNISGYQIADDINSNRLNFICEYQIPCNGSLIGRCQNNGTCYSNPGEDICLCAPGYTGENCEMEILECTSSSSSLHTGMCIKQFCFHVEFIFELFLVVVISFI